MYASIRQTVKILGISECFLRRMARQGKLPGFRSGVKFLINVERLKDMLDAGLTEEAESIEER